MLDDRTYLRLIAILMFPTEQEALQALTTDVGPAGALDDALQPNGWFEGRYGGAFLTSRTKRSPLTTSEATGWLAHARVRGWIENAPMGGLELTEAGREHAGLGPRMKERNG